MEYKTFGEMTEIYITKKNGNRFTVKIDTEDLQIILNHKSWNITRFKKNIGYYSSTTEYLGYVDGKPKYKTILMHRLLTNAQDAILVDHRNHDSLDNRKENLRMSTFFENNKNRKSKNANNTSGYRNVSKIKDQWVVQMQVEGKNTKLKSFPLELLDEAGAYAAEMRKVYYGSFAGNS